MKGFKLVLLIVAVVVSISLLASPCLLAQTFTGDILGTVADATGAVVIGAEITARNSQTNVSFKAMTGEDGRYVFSRLQPGNYEITATASGFKRSVASDVNLLVGNRLTVNLQLQIGEVTSTVEVSAAEELVKADDVVLGQVITQQSIVSLPLNGRNFIQLSQLSPGVLQIGTAISPATSWVGRSDSAIVVAGLRETDSSYLLDGIETRSPRWGNSGFRPSVDVIQEFNIQRNAFTADQGWGTTVVNTVLRSGANELRGTLFEFIRNDKMDARNFFDRGDRPPFKQNQFGFALGGPVVKDRVFFFGNYEGFRQRLSTTLQGRFPTPQELQGRFQTTVRDPLTGQPFPNNIIPQERIDPVIRKVIPFVAVPNRPEDPALNYLRAPSRISDFDQIHAKVDLKLGSSDQLFVRYSWVDEDLLQPALVEGLGLRRPLGDKNVVISHTHPFGSRTVNEFRVGYNRNLNFNVTESAFGPNIAQELGIRNTSTNPANFSLPVFSITGYSGIGQGATATLETIDDIYQFNENLTAHRGKHTVKLGADIRRNALHFTGDFPSTPSFRFQGFYTGNAVGDFLLGLSDFAQGFKGDTTANLHTTNWALYLQDDWKIHPKLNLNFGLRYEYPAPFSEENSKFNYFDTKSRTFVNRGQRLFEPDRNNFAPRFGFAYSPFSKTVIRGGFGIFYDLIAGNETQFYGLLNPPNSQIISLNNTLPTPSFQVNGLFPSREFAPSISPNTTDPFNRTPYVYQYNFNLQREVTGILFEAGYVGSTGHKLNRRFNLNLAPPNRNVPLADRRPFPGFSDIITSLNNGWSNYNGFNFKAEKRHSSGAILLVSYTLGKHLDTGGPDEYAHYDLSGSLKELKGPASLDTRHRLVASYVYEIPTGRGKRLGSNVSGIADKLLSGWQVNGIATFASGQPRTPTPAGDFGIIGSRRIQPANRIGPGNSDELKSNIRKQPTLFPYFNVNDFQLSLSGTVGNGGRGTIVGPGINNWDMGLLKDTRVNERVTVQFRAEFFNIFNHAQFASLDTNISSPTFGRITSARESRDIQFGLKIQF